MADEKGGEQIIADLHIHSRFSRATSKNLDIANLEKYARIKGINLLGTGDFQHPYWSKELEVLEERDGILYTKTGFPFLWQTEISLIYTQDGKGRRIHYVILAPDKEVAKQATEFFKSKGRIDYDGRPIFGFSSVELVDELMKISEDIEVIPAHCLLPDSYVHLEKEVKKIRDIKKGEVVMTHKGRFRKVKEVLKREYSGKLYKITPWYFCEGLTTTPEHPFYAIKSHKNCPWTKGLCKPLCSEVKNCKNRHYEKYSPEWIAAEDVNIGDFLVYPRFKDERDVDKINLTEFVKEYVNFDDDFVLPKNSRNNRGLIKKNIILNKDFCRLIGYYLSEGYLIRDEAVAFSFNSKEKEYIEEVVSLMQKIFGITDYKIDSRRQNQADIIFYSKILNEFFRVFYFEKEKRAWSKAIPSFILFLSKEKLAEVLRGWWRGDFGCSVSRQLINQMKQICLKLGIIPSISIIKSEDFNKRGKHFIGDREIISKRDFFVISNLSFFEEDYGMLKEECFRRSINKLKRKHGWVDENYAYLPVRKIEIKDYTGEVYNLEVEEDNSYVSEFACVHNCWTPWFGIFGSMSGFDSLKEAFQEKVGRIHAIETGMSSDPEMNWRIKELNSKSIVSFSDLHSFWPWRIGREATIFLGELSYKNILRQIRENSFKATIETDPAYGKYHFDGHRTCNFSCPPEESKKLNNICPVCKKSLTIGVENRVEQLAGNPVGFMPGNAKLFYKILPLHELIALAKASTLASRKTWLVYNNLIEKFGSELNVLLHVEKIDLAKFLKDDELLVKLIIDNRIANIKVKPGYDGVYGEPLLKEKQAKLS